MKLLPCFCKNRRNRLRKDLSKANTQLNETRLLIEPTLIKVQRKYQAIKHGKTILTLVLHCNAIGRAAKARHSRFHIPSKPKLSTCV